MADKEQVEQAVNEAEKKEKRKMLIMGVVLVGIMLLEGIGVFVAMKMFGSKPADAQAALKDDQPGEDSEEPKLSKELLVEEIEAPNTLSNRSYLVQMTVQASVAENEFEQVELAFEANRARIRDRLEQVIRAADPDMLSLSQAAKPDVELKGIRSRFKTILEEVCGENTIEEVIITRYMPMPVDY